jgi:ParB-like chromosome segregation protein Spo0J
MQNSALNGKVNHGGLLEINHHEAPELLPLNRIYPASENDTVYKPIDPTDPEFLDLVASVKASGVKVPLVVTLDNCILSGHRRHAAARYAGLAVVPCFRENITRAHPDFLRRLTEYNQQRTKTNAEKLRESVIQADPEDTYQALISHREETARLSVDSVEIIGEKTRKRISSAKTPFLEAARKVISERREFWPLSVRQVHYALLNDPPRKHANKPDSIYQNDPQSYSNLVNLLARARVAGDIAFHCLADETRPVITWHVHKHTGPFIKEQLDEFLKNYRRDLQQSQPNHIEIVGEKNTVAGILRPVAMRYNIPLTTARGFSSLDPRFQMVKRFKKSGKQKLILIVLSDFDPSGESIFESFVKSLRGDFGIYNFEPIKAALTPEQISRYQLPPGIQAKKTDSRAKKFIEQYGPDVYELEALPPRTLQEELTRTIDSVLDVVAFNQEIDAEKADSLELDTFRRRAHLALAE